MKNQNLFLSFLCGVVALLVIAAAGPAYVGKVRYVSDISTNQIPLSGVTNAGTAAYSNATAFAVLNTTNAFLGPIGIGTNTPSHKLSIVSTTNDEVEILSTGSDSASMVHFENVGSQGPFIDFSAAGPNHWAWGVASAGAFHLRYSGSADAINGTTMFAVATDGTLTGNAAGLTNFSGLTANITVVTNGSDTMTLKFTNGILKAVSAP